ncbi:carbon-nitrogen hydrolase family protein [Paenibacillus sp. HWE-109]|uniref:carbon-nitrogen hydrolase family protein n=1 Tax=Paenibacillus sp. HWE-109 TaxID=1306526 RepID=UPI001EDDFA35|nr:carbon-nitrogen hydrolase family protein [Paenibacillus sp. HWE-109]UKS28929.1 carbon-nitrogen hydrolase family protein [Paenibacillus sp. HWE-109]
MYMQTLKVATAQYGLADVQSDADFWSRLGMKLRETVAKGANLIIFPEYVTAHLLSHQPVMTHEEACRHLNAYTSEYIAFFQRYSRELNVVILGGTHICQEDKGFVNKASLFFPDGRIEEQNKLHLTPEERNRWPLAAGDKLNIIETQWGRWAILTCYDIEFPELARLAGESGVQLVLCPSYTDSAFGYHRVRYCCQARAIENQYYVVLSGMVGSLPDERPQVDQGYCQAGIFTPCDVPFSADGIIQAGEVNRDMFVFAELDFAKLHANHKQGVVAPFYDRRRVYNRELRKMRIEEC